MRDIRKDLQERLTAAERRRIGVQAQLDELDKEVKLIRSLLDLENGRATATIEIPASPSMGITNGAQRRGELVILGALGVGKSGVAAAILNALTRIPASKDVLREVVERDVPGLNSPARSVHLTLVNLKKRGRVREDADGTYHLEQEGTPESETQGHLLQN